VRDLDDLSASLERLRRSIPEVFGNDAQQTEQQRRLVDLALDVGRTLTRFNFPQAEVFNPLGILLAHHLAQLDEAQRTAAEGAENNNNPGDDQQRLGVADAILPPPATGTARETEPADDGGESSGAGDEIAMRNSRRTDPTPPPGDITVDPTRVGPTSGNLVFLTESFLDEEPDSGLEDQSSTIDTATEDRAEVGTSTQPNRLPEADSSPRVEVSRPEGSEGHGEPSGDVTPVTPPTPIYHDPRPPFETDGRGRVVRSNSSQQARLRSRSSPSLQRRKFSNGETNTTREKEVNEVPGPGIETEVRDNVDGDNDDDC